MPDLTWVLSSAVLILAVIALRAAFGRRMRPGLRCALWALVLLRLLVPVQLFPAPWGVSAKLPERVAEQEVYLLPVERAEHPASAVVSSGPAGVALLEDLLDERTQLTERNDETWTFTRYAEKRSVAEILQIVWLVGVGVTAAVFVGTNLRFAVRLRRRRRPLAVDCPLRVYAVEGLASSCLFGTAIYVAAETAQNERRLRHVLAHELSHRRHGDPVWTLLRCVALALHWYHPLVWWAAALSRQDSELWADTGALRQLGEAEREPYGATLIALSTGRSAKSALLCTATAMTNGKRSLKERVTMIAQRPRMTAAVVAAVTLLAALAAGCAFAGAEAKPEPDTEIQNTAEITQTSDDSLRPTEAELAEYGIVYDAASKTEVYNDPMDKLLLYVLGAEGDCATAADEALYQAWNRATDHDAPTETLSQAIQALSPERAAWVRAHIAALRESHAKPFYGLMGLDGWYEEYQTAPHHTCRRYYVAMGDNRSIEIGCSFNFSIEDYVVDLDGDGVTELVCNCVYGGDGAQRLRVYRRNGDRIERGSIDAAKLDLGGWDNWGVNSTGERYDPETGTITVEYASDSGGTVRTVGLDALAWEPYAELAPLTEEALEGWREALSTFQMEDMGAVTSTPVSCFFTSTYADPRDLDLAQFLAYCFPLEEPVEEEAEFETVVRGTLWEELVNSEDGSTRKRTLSDMPVPVHRYRVSRINELLSQYAGITVDDLSTDWRHDGRTIYVPEYDAFYNFTSDFGPGVFEPRSGERSGDIVTLRGDHTVLKLRVTDGGYHILSHLPIGAESTEDG